MMQNCLNIQKKVKTGFFTDLAKKMEKTR